MTDDKVSAFKAKYPDRVIALQGRLRRLLGIAPSNQSQFAQQAVTEQVDAILAMLCGVSEPDPVSRDVPTVRVPAESQT